MVQFCANDPKFLIKAAHMVAPYCDAVDINFGCPQRIAKRGNYGAFLMDDWGTVERLVRELSQVGRLAGRWGAARRGVHACARARCGANACGDACGGRRGGRGSPVWPCSRAVRARVCVQDYQLAQGGR